MNEPTTWDMAASLFDNVLIPLGVIGLLAVGFTWLTARFGYLSEDEEDTDA